MGGGRGRADAFVNALRNVPGPKRWLVKRRRI
jgi:hypothetical protein